MNANFSRRGPARQGGIALIELALILVLSSFLLPVLFLFARVFYHYNVLKQATQDAANHMAAMPRIELMTSAGMAAAKGRAENMVIAAISEAGITPPEEIVIEVLCNNGGACASSVPVTEVQVIALFILFDGFWQDTGRWLSDESGASWTITTSSSATFQN